MDILVGNADYPTEAISKNAKRDRQLGIGYANLGALLMALGVPYDSDLGRAIAAAFTALMTAVGYHQSAVIARRMGPFDGYAENVEPMLHVLAKHQELTSALSQEADLDPSWDGGDREPLATAVSFAARGIAAEQLALARVVGVRNSQISVLAPTGTISFLMDCDTSGVEPDLSLVKTKKLVGGGTMSIVNQSIPRALTNLGYSAEQSEAILSYIDENKSIVGAPGLKPEHLPVFACSMGDNTIDYSGHIRMMGAIQPFISGAISKTVNLPEDATVEDIEQLYLEAWKLGIKAVAVYRDNCKVAQPLSTTKTDAATAALAEPTGQAARIAELEALLAQHANKPIRERLPPVRNSKTGTFDLDGCDGYWTVGEYDDGRPGELFLKVSKQGSTLSGFADAVAIAVSTGLQHGVPLSQFVKKYQAMKFAPAGITDDPELRMATSLLDYIFRKLAVIYLDPSEREVLGIATPPNAPRH